MKKKNVVPEVPAGVKEVKEVELDVLKRAAWNTHAVMKKKDPGFKGMVASVKESGLIHRIAVKDLGDGTYCIIDGHRRFEAAKAAGLEKVQVDVWDVTDEQAKIMTATANIQRAENDPILEAELFETLEKSGMKAREIGAKLGKDEKYVARRMRLTSLTENWKGVARTVPVTVECLENIAAHEPELQDEVFDERVGETPDEDGYSWGDFSRSFEGKMRRIAQAKFDTSACANCPFNTATHGVLFADMEDAEAKCQKAACYVEKNNALVDAKIAKLKEKGEKVVQVRERYAIPNSWDVKDERDRKHTQAYVFEQGGMRYLVFGAKPEKKEKEALTKEEKEAQKEQKRIEKAKRKAVTDSCARIRAGIEENADGIDKAINLAFKREAFRAWIRRHLFKGSYGYLAEDDCFDLVRAVGTEILANELGIVFEGEERQAVDEALKRREEEDAVEAVDDDDGDDGEAEEEE